MTQSFKEAYEETKQAIINAIGQEAWDVGPKRVTVWRTSLQEAPHVRQCSCKWSWPRYTNSTEHFHSFKFDSLCSHGHTNLEKADACYWRRKGPTKFDPWAYEA